VPLRPKRKRRPHRVYLGEERVGFRELPNGNFEIAVIIGSQIPVFELPKEAWEAVQKQGYIELQRET
jgi:hypothetical protein